jgi:thiamine-monophosphate kinase
MNYEAKIIDLINEVMPKSPLRKSKSREADAEVIQLGDKTYLFTTDEFSKEDLFRENDPYILGWNIACGAISDIIATGGNPLIYSHAMVVSKDWDEKYIKQFSKGIAEVLQKYEISFIGGDLGSAEYWRYTASVIGEPVGRLINRKGCKPGDSIFITGKIGTGNFDAALNLYSENRNVESLLKGVKSKFRTHENLSEIISKFASAAIDTSDGVFSGLQTLSELNKTGFNIDNLHFINKGFLAAKILNLPKLLLFLGECGEYEILFTVSKQNKDSLIAEMKAHKLPVYTLGKITEHEKDKTILSKNKFLNFAEYNLRARDFENVKDYLKNMIDWILEAERL